MEVFNIGIELEEKTLEEQISVIISKKYNFLHFKSTKVSEGIWSQNAKDFDVLITDKEVKDEKVLRLVKSKDEELLESGEEMRLFKYAGAEMLSKTIFRIIYEITGHKILLRESKECHVIGFFSLLHINCWDSILKLGKLLNNNYNKKILYLNTNYVDWNLQFNGSSEMQLIRMIYYMDNNKEFPIENFIKDFAGDIDILSDVGIPNLMSTLTTNQLLAIIRMVQELGRYDYIFLDFGQNLAASLKEILKKIALTIYFHSDFRSDHAEEEKIICQNILTSIDKKYIKYVDIEEEDIIVKTAKALEEVLQNNSKDKEIQKEIL